MRGWKQGLKRRRKNCSCLKCKHFLNKVSLKLIVIILDTNEHHGLGTNYTQSGLF